MIITLMRPNCYPSGVDSESVGSLDAGQDAGPGEGVAECGEGGCAHAHAQLAVGSEMAHRVGESPGVGCRHQKCLAAVGEVFLLRAVGCGDVDGRWPCIPGWPVRMPPP